MFGRLKKRLACTLILTLIFLLFNIPVISAKEGNALQRGDIVYLGKWSGIDLTWSAVENENGTTLLLDKVLKEKNSAGKISNVLIKFLNADEIGGDGLRADGKNPNTYIGSTIQKWLNKKQDGFDHQAFSDSEQELLTNASDEYEGWSYLLSADEANSLTKNERRGLDTTNQAWWLRTPDSIFIDKVKIIKNSGVYKDPNSVSGTVYTRPALKTDLSSVIYMSGAGTAADPYRLYSKGKTNVPTMTASSKDRKIITLHFNNQMKQIDNPNGIQNGFTVMANGHLIEVAEVQVDEADNSQVTLTLNENIPVSSTVNVSYNLDKDNKVFLVYGDENNVIGDSAAPEIVTEALSSEGNLYINGTLADSNTLTSIGAQKETVSYNLNNAVTVSHYAVWKLYDTAQGGNELTDHTIDLNGVNEKTVYIQVTAEDGTAKEYPIKIMKNLSQLCEIVNAADFAVPQSEPYIADISLYPNTAYYDFTDKIQVSNLANWAIPYQQVNYLIIRTL